MILEMIYIIHTFLKKTEDWSLGLVVNLKLEKYK